VKFQQAGFSLTACLAPKITGRWSATLPLVGSLSIF